MATKKKEQKKFNYAVGFYWNGEDGSVGCYMCGSEVHFGTLKEAQDHRKYVSAQQDNTTIDRTKREYKIFQLVEVPE